MARKRVAILISGRGSNMVALIEAAKDPAYPAEIALVVSNEPGGGGLASARRPKASAPPVVDHRPFGKDREAFERALQDELAGAQDRARLPRGLHAAADALVRAAMGRPAAQHPSCAAAGVQGPRHPRTRASPPARSSTARPCISSCRRWIPARSSRRPRCRCATATPKQRSRRACSRSSTASIRRRCGGGGRPRADRRRPLPDRRHSPPLLIAASRPDPDLVVVERRAAIRRDRVGAGHRVDAACRRDRRRSARSIPRSARRGARLRTRGRAAAPARACCRSRPPRRRRCRAFAASSGWIITSGRPRFCAREVGVSLKVELRKPRDGEVASRIGCAVVGLLDDGPVVGQLRHLRDRAGVIGAAERHVRPVRLEAEFSVRIGEALDVVRGLEVRLAVDPFLALEPLKRAPAGFLQRVVDQLARASWRSPDARRRPAWRCRSSPRGWSGTRPAARSASARG